MVLLCRNNATINVHVKTQNRVKYQVWHTDPWPDPAKIADLVTQWPVTQRSGSISGSIIICQLLMPVSQHLPHALTHAHNRLLTQRMKRGHVTKKRGREGGACTWQWINKLDVHLCTTIHVQSVDSAQLASHLTVWTFQPQILQQQQHWLPWQHALSIQRPQWVRSSTAKQKVLD